MRVLLTKNAYVGTRLHVVPTEVVRGVEVFKPVEVDLPDEAAKDLIAAGTALPVASNLRTAVDPAAAAARKAVKLGE